MLGGEIKVVMTLDNGQFTIQTQKAGQVIQQLTRSIEQTSTSTQRLEKHFTGLHGQFRSLVQTASMLRYAIHDIHDVFMALPGAILKSSGEFERMTLLLAGMSKETTKAAREAEALSNVKFIFNMAERAPFEVKALTDAFVKMKSAGLDPTNGSMQALVDSVAKFGGTSETMHRASIAIQQMAGKGVISMEELRQQLGEAVPNAIEMMSQGAGMSIQKFTKLVSTGAVEAKTALQNMFSVMSFQNAGAAQEMMNSWVGLLSLLKTRFELFKKEAGDSAFFNNAKQQLQDLIGMFGTNDAKRLANDLGQGLSQIVTALRAVIDFTREWWSWITLAGKAFLAYFVAQKAGALFGGVRDAVRGQIDLYKGLVRAEQDRLNEKLKAISGELAAEQSALDRKKAGWAKEQADLEQREAKERAASIRRMERQRREAAEELAALDTKYRNALRMQQQFLGQQMAAEMAAEAAMRQKKAGSAAQARALEAEASRLGNNASIAAAQVAKYKAEIDAIRQRDAALVNSIATTQKATTATIANSAAAAELATHTARIISLQNAKAAATKAAEIGMTGLSRAMTGLKVVFDAFGGWVGLAIGVLVTLGQYLWNYMNRWEQFAEIVDRTKKGIASKEDYEGAIKRAEEAADKALKLKKILESIDADPNGARTQARARSLGFVDQGGRADVAAFRASIQRQYDEQYKIAKEAQATYNEQERLMERDAVATNLAQFQRIYERATVDRIDAIRKQYADLTKEEEKAIAEARTRAQANGRNLTESEEQATRKQYIDRRNTLIVEEKRFRLAYAQQMDDWAAQSVASTTGAAKKSAEEIRRFTMEQLKTAREALNQTSTLGQQPTVVKDPQASLKENPIVRKAEEIKAAVAEAEVKYAEALAGIKQINATRNQIAVNLLGDIAQGKFDTKENGPDGKEKVINRFGDLDQRKNYVKKFLEEVVQGQKTIEQFVAGLKLSKKEADAVLELIQGMTRAAELGDGAKAITRSNELLADTIRDLDASKEELVTNGMAKESRALNQLIGQYDELLKKLAETDPAYAKVQEARNKAVDAATEARNNRSLIKMREDSRQFIEATVQDTERSRVARERSTMDYLEVAKAVYDEELRAFQVKEAAIRRDIDDRLRAGSISAAIAQEEISKIEDAGNAYRAESFARYLQNSKSELQKLGENWQNTVNGMNTATANWANATMDYITKALNGEKVGKFKEVIANMLRDINAMFIKKNFGDLITSAFGQIGGKVGDMLGLGLGKGKDAGAAATASAMTTMATATTTAQTTMTTAVTTAMTTITTAITTAAQAIAAAAMTMSSTGSGSSFMSILNGIKGDWGPLDAFKSGFGDAIKVAQNTDWSSILKDMVPDVGTDFIDFGEFFANGGIMTGKGSMQLRKYASGGIATKPQLAMFGEGSTPEAYVPLPDGRTIPVTMNGNVAAGTSNNVSINIVVNSDGSSSQSESQSGSGGEQSWRLMAERVRGIVMEELVTQQRPGGALYR